MELLGWLYQFYISERKNQVMARKSAVPTEDIPAVTQLFTPHWIVRYLIENSLGRLWLLNRPGSPLREQMPYYIEAERETDFVKITKPEEIRVLDPACGSGHMLTYAFDLLYAIYEEEGYPASDIPALILRHNLTAWKSAPVRRNLPNWRCSSRPAKSPVASFIRKTVRPNVIDLQNVASSETSYAAMSHALGSGRSHSMRLCTGCSTSSRKPRIRFAYPAVPRRNGRSQLSAEPSSAKETGSELFLLDTHIKSPACPRTSRGAHPALSRRRDQSALHGALQDERSTQRAV